MRVGSIGTFARCFAVLAVLTFIAGAEAAVINVPGDQPTIQAGINAAMNGDEVVVAPGTYAEIIDLSGKAITLRSSGGADVTTIDATTVSDPGDGKPVIRCDSGEGPDTIIEGFTLTGGTGDTAVFGSSDIGGGGGMYNGVGVSPTINDCVFTANGADYGGGMFNNEASPTIAGCTFNDNSAEYYGGGMFNLNASPTVSDCVFTADIAQQGGAIHNRNGSSVVFSDCHIFANHAESWGAGIYHKNGDLTLTGCTLLANTAESSGGGLFGENLDLLTMANCRVIGNVSGFNGGGIQVGADPGLTSAAVLTNCAFIGNVVNSGDSGGISVYRVAFDIVNCTFANNVASTNGGGLNLRYSDPVITNSIFWGNSDASGTGATAQIYLDGALNPVVSYSIVQGGWSGAGSNNLDADPLFADIDGTDDTIGTDDDDARLVAGSPAIDSGDTPTAAGFLGPLDLADVTRLQGDPATADTGVAVLGVTIDRGPYEYVEAPEATGACCLPLGDCVVVAASTCLDVGGTYAGDDVACANANCPAFCLGDMNRDGVLDGRDIQIMIEALLAGVTCP